MYVEYLEAHPEFRIYFGPGPRISKIDPKLMSRIYALHPVMHLNENEALSFTKEDGIDAAANAVFSRTQNDVIITLGAKGAYYRTASSSGYVPGIAATQIDTIGAGDSHIGAVIACEQLGKSLPESIRIANRIAA